MIKNLIFDFDGVIVDSFDFHREKIKAFTWKELSEEDFRSMHHGNFFDHSVEHIKTIKWSDYRDFIASEQRSFSIDEFIKKDLFTLSLHYKLFIVSSWWDRNIIPCLEYNWLASIFEEVLGLESGYSKKDKFEFLWEKYTLLWNNSFFIMDTLWDIKEANEVNLPALGLVSKYSSRENLSLGNPFQIFDDFSEIPLFLENYKK